MTTHQYEDIAAARRTLGRAIQQFDQWFQAAATPLDLADIAHTVQLAAEQLADVVDFPEPDR
jgi:hypothetical protein